MNKLNKTSKKLSDQLTRSIRVGKWRVETLDTTRFAECVLGHVGIKCVCGYVFWSLWNMMIEWFRIICILNKCILHSSSILHPACRAVYMLHIQYLQQGELGFWHNEVVIVFLCTHTVTETQESENHVGYLMERGL